MTTTAEQRVLDAEVVDHAAEEFEAIARDFDNHGHNSAAESARARAHQLRQVLSRMVAALDVPHTSPAIQTQEIQQPQDTPSVARSARRPRWRSTAIVWAWAVATPVTALAGQPVWWPYWLMAALAWWLCSMDVIDWIKRGAPMGWRKRNA